MSPQNNQKIVEPAIDFELDVKAEIEGGKCVLHPKEVKLDSDTDFYTKVTLRAPSSPKGAKKTAGRKGTEMFFNRSTANNTVFFIPGVEVKVWRCVVNRWSEDRLLCCELVDLKVSCWTSYFCMLVIFLYVIIIH